MTPGVASSFPLRPDSLAVLLLTGERDGEELSRGRETGVDDRGDASTGGVEAEVDGGGRGGSRSIESGGESPAEGLRGSMLRNRKS